MKSMKFIEPIIVTDATLISTNIPETEADAWNVSTDYEIGDRVQIVASHTLYESLTDHSGKNPPDYLEGDTPDWKLVGATNPWRMFDGKSRAASDNEESIDVSIAPGILVNALTLLGIIGRDVTVTVVDPVDGTVYERKVDMVDNTGVNDFYDWFFTPPARKTTVLLTDLPAYPGATISIEVYDPGVTVEVGELIPGRTKHIGTTLNGVRLGLKDYSDKTIDEYGNAKLVEGLYANRVEYPISIETYRVAGVRKVLAGFRATPLVYIGDERFAEVVNYGFYRDFAIVIGGDVQSTCTLEIEEFI